MTDCSGVKALYGSVVYGVNLGAGNDTFTVTGAVSNQINGGLGPDVINANDGFLQEIYCGSRVVNNQTVSDGSADTVHKDALDHVHHCNASEGDSVGA
jgi:hypothetical protein